MDAAADSAGLPAFTAAHHARTAWSTEVLPALDHELRTPLTKVAGWCELLLAGELGELGEAQRHAVEGVAEAARDLVEAVVASQGAVERDLVLGTDVACRTCRVLLEGMSACRPCEDAGAAACTGSLVR